jgi:4-amino-4-deoxy-L-arabinose transferase-like glycosyltransferase
MAGTYLLAKPRWVERLFDALTDPARRERTMLAVLGGYFVVWSLYAAVAKSSQDIHTDMGEFVAWSREVGLGTPKHPPLGAWLVRAWFAVLPREDWAYYCFAILLPTVALWVTWRFAARYLPPDKRVVGIALLTLVPFYNFHALKFNANTVLTPFWALTTWWFFRSFETRRVGWAALAGIGAAAAMLAKYWSITLLAGLGCAALSDPRRNAYFSSPAPYVTLAFGTIVLTPNIHWLTTHAFMPFGYAVGAHSGAHGLALVSALLFTASGLAYAAAAIVFAVLAAQPNPAAIRDTLWPADAERRTLLIAFAVPFVVPVLIAVVLTIAVESIWVTPAMTLLPVVLLSSPLVAVSRLAAVRVLALAVLFPPVMLAVSPLVALLVHLNGIPNNGSDFRLAAQAIERLWRAHTDRPLRILGGTTPVDGIVFYFKDMPSTLNIDNPKLTPWVDADRIRRDGAALICAETDEMCMVAMASFAGHFPIAADEDVVLSRRFFGFASPPERYEIMIIVPDES